MCWTGTSTGAFRDHKCQGFLAPAALMVLHQPGQVQRTASDDKRYQQWPGKSSACPPDGNALAWPGQPQLQQQTAGGWTSPTALA
jgi:hypothetical protein